MHKFLKLKTDYNGGKRIEKFGKGIICFYLVNRTHQFG